MLLDDVLDSLPRRQKKGADGWWDGRRDLSNLFIADDAGPAGHVRYQPESGGSALDRKSRFGNTADAADFYTGRENCLHELIDSMSK